MFLPLDDEEGLVARRDHPFGAESEKSVQTPTRHTKSTAIRKNRRAQPNKYKMEQVKSWRSIITIQPFGRQKIQINIITEQASRGWIQVGDGSWAGGHPCPLGSRLTRDEAQLSAVCSTHLTGRHRVQLRPLCLWLPEAWRPQRLEEQGGLPLPLRLQLLLLGLLASLG